MEKERKTWDNGFPGRKNELDEIVGKIPLRSILVTMASIFVFLVVLFYVSSGINYPCSQKAEVNFLSGTKNRLLANIRLTCNDWDTLRQGQYLKIAIKDQITKKEIILSAKINSIEPYNEGCHVQVSVDPEKYASNESILLPNKPIQAQILVDGCQRNMLGFMFEKISRSIL